MFRGTKIRMEKQNKKIYWNCCKTKRQWVDVFKVLERKKEEGKKRGDSQPQILYLAQISFKNEKKDLFQTNRTKIVINSTTINVRFLGRQNRYQREIWIYTEYSEHSKNQGKYKRHFYNLSRK